MTVTVTQPTINVREKLAELDKPTGIAGEAMLRAETPQEQQALVGISGRRNLLQNGAMTISQRGTTFTSPSSGTFTLDRWNYERGGGAACTIEQSTDAPNGFGNSIKVTVTTPEGSIGSGDFSQLLYQIEGQDIAPLAYGTSDAKPMVLSFWVKSSVTGSFPFGLQNHNGTRVFPVTYTINHPNTWEYKTISITGDTGGTWVTSGNTVGLRFTFLWVSGSNFTTGVDGGGWTATSSYLGLTSTYTAPIDATNATLQITGVQLELGKVATPFEHRSYGEELALCQRYYYKTYNQSVTPGTVSLAGASASITSTTSSTVHPHYFQFPVEMRASPSLTPYSISGTANRASTSGSYSTSSNTDQTILTSQGGTRAALIISYTTSFQDGYYSMQHLVADAEL